MRRLLVFILLAASSLPGTARAGLDPKYAQWSAELKLGFYRPVISTAPQVVQVRTKLYGDAAYYARPLLYTLQVDRYLVDTGGLLGVYMHAGYWSESGASRKCFDGDTVVQCDANSVLSSVKGTDTASFRVVPLGAGVVYQIDWLRRWYDFPLSAKVRAGVDYNLWFGSVGETRSRIVQNDGQGKRQSRDAKGGNLGVSAAVSVALALDQFSRQHQAYGDDGDGQHSYVFLEYAVKYGGWLFNDKPFINLSDVSILSLGLAIDFL